MEGNFFDGNITYMFGIHYKGCAKIYVKNNFDKKRWLIIKNFVI